MQIGLGSVDIAVQAQRFDQANQDQIRDHMIE
jgi:hypothetical protein